MRIKNYFDALNGEETQIYFEKNTFLVENKKYILFLNNLKPAFIYTFLSQTILVFFLLITINLFYPRAIEMFLPAFLVNNTRYKELFEDMRKKKMLVISILFFMYNIIYGILCRSSTIHVYQNRNLIYDNPFHEYLFMQELQRNLKDI